MNIVAVGAHPDDIEICAGGTLLRWASEPSHRVTVVVLSDGTGGSVSSETPAESIASTRANEARDAAKLMGADFVGLGMPDGRLVDSDDSRMALVEVLRRTHADVVLGPPLDDYNADHVAVAHAVNTACLWSCVPAFASESPALTRVPALWCFDSIGGRGEQPEVYVDISDVFDRKLELLHRHESQFALTTRLLGADLADIVQRTNAFRGLQAGVAYAEGFRAARDWPRIRTSSWDPWPA